MVIHCCALLLVIKHLAAERARALATVRTTSMQGVGTKLGTLAKLAIHAKLRNRLQGFENGKNIWSGREDSNLRPPGPEPGALPG